MQPAPLEMVLRQLQLIVEADKRQRDEGFHGGLAPGEPGREELIQYARDQAELRRNRRQPGDADEAFKIERAIAEVSTFCADCQTPLALWDQDKEGVSEMVGSWKNHVSERDPGGILTSKVCPECSGGAPAERTATQDE